MKTIAKLTASAAVLLALAGPSLAASRQRAVTSGDVNTVRTYGDLDPANPPYRGSAYSAQRYWGGADNTGHPYQYAPGRSLPYPDRPYGDPDID